MNRFWIARTAACIALLHAGLAASAAGDDWKRVTPEERALASPRVDRTADAEALFWDIRLEDRCDASGCETEFSHYLRIKVFTEAGVQATSRVDIPYSKSVHIDDIAARTVHADGSEIQLKKSDIFDRTIVKARGVKVQARSFVLPAVEVGSIIEYRWTEVRIDQLSTYVRLLFQRDIPVERVVYHVRPLEIPGAEYSMMSLKFHGYMTPFEREPDGFYVSSMDNVPAYHEEPHMPPEAQARPWMLLYYLPSDRVSAPPDDYWADFGRRLDDTEAALLRLSPALRQMAAQAVAGAADPETRLDRLCRACRASIRNASLHPQGLSEHDRRALGRKSTADQTLDRGVGTAWDIDVVFAALARAAGFDARVAVLDGRDDLYFSPSLGNAYFLGAFDVAVKVGDGWRFYDPADPLLRPGKLGWKEEGVPALVPDDKAPHFVVTPETAADSSLVQRVATVRLTEQGDLDGRMRVELHGHPATDERQVLAGESAAKQGELVGDLMKERVAGATLSDVHVAGIDDPDQPLVYSFAIHAPGYAQRTGKRLFVQPAVFEHSLAAVFPSPRRAYPIDFHYAWLERDSIVIALPEGYELEPPEAPTPAILPGCGVYQASFAAVSAETLVVYRRVLRMDRWSIEQSQYDGVKSFFDAVHEQDGRTLALRRGEGARDSSAAAGAH